jgi:putative transcriptional regulator
MIEIRIDELLETRGRSFYWLAKETGISHTTLWRLKKGKALGINFDTLDRLCQTLECQLGEVLSHTKGKKIRKKPSQEDARRSGKSLSRHATNTKAIKEKDNHSRHSC